MLLKVYANVFKLKSLQLTSDTETAPLEDVFLAYRDESPVEVMIKIEALEDRLQRDIVKSVAAVALRDRRHKVLKLCLDRGFTYEYYFEDAANLVSEMKSPKTYQVIEESDFRKENPRRIRRHGKTRPVKPEPSGAFDKWGSISMVIWRTGSYTCAILA